MTISHISNLEPMSSVRSKLNQVIDLVGQDPLLISHNSITTPIAQFNNIDPTTEVTMPLDDYENELFKMENSTVLVKDDLNQGAILSWTAHLTKTNNTEATVYTWIESSIDGGANWSAIGNTFRAEYTPEKAQEHVINRTVPQSSPIFAGTLFRLKIAQEGGSNVELAPSDPVTLNSGAVMQGAAVRVAVWIV